MNKRLPLYGLSFLEGGAVMAVELIGAKLLAPYFGTSLYVWAAVLGVTLGGLTLGYFTGGLLSRRYSGRVAVLYRVLVLAGAFTAVMPVTSGWIMETTIDWELRTGAIASLLCFMLPPLLLMGMVSPLIINLLTDRADRAGNRAGNVYAISTLGGILATFLLGFYVIPGFGLSGPALVTGIILAVLPALALLRGGRVAVPLVLLLAVGLGIWHGGAEEYPDDYKLLYESEGIMGQLRVVDHPAYGFSEDDRPGRALIVNNTLQTIMDRESGYSMWEWARYFAAPTSLYPPGSRVLLLGLGGGTVLNQMEAQGFTVDVVEIDRRVRDVAVNYFGVNPDLQLIVDDARHYVRTTETEYDIIIFDTFLSESVPEHLLTVEGFNDARRILKPGGLLMTNFYGFLQGRNGLAARSVYKTLQASGFQVELLATPGDAMHRNLIFLASEEVLPLESVSYREGQGELLDNLPAFIIDPMFISTDHAEVLHDSRPSLARLYQPAALAWKAGYRQYYREHFGI